MEQLNEVWNVILEEMHSEFSSLLIQLWFSDLEYISHEGARAVFRTKSKFKKDRLEEKYRHTVEEYLTAFYAEPIRAEFVFDGAGEEEEKAALPEKEENGQKKPAQPTVKAHRLNYTFDNFIVGNSNKFAHAACTAIARDPAGDYNPLFLYGASGLGKTHLLYAITNEILRKRPESVIIYVKGEDFTNQMIESISSSTTSQFRAKYRKADVLLIDDIQFIENKEATKEEFFHTFDALIEDSRQIVIASDRPPREIKIEDRLQSRFEGGLIVDIQPPDLELRIAIMKNKAKTIGLSLSNEIFNFLAENLTNNVRQIEGAIKTIAAQSFLTGVDNITIEFVKSCVSDLITEQRPVTVTIDRIFEVVSKQYKLPLSDIKSRKQTKDIAKARHISIYLIKSLTDMSFTSIGKIFSRDRTTIMSSNENVENEIRSNSLFEMEINDLIKSIKS